MLDSAFTFKKYLNNLQNVNDSELRNSFCLSLTCLDLKHDNHPQHMTTATTIKPPGQSHGASGVCPTEWPPANAMSALQKLKPLIASSRPARCLPGHHSCLLIVTMLIFESQFCSNWLFEDHTQVSSLICFTCIRESLLHCLHPA